MQKRKLTTGIAVAVAAIAFSVTAYADSHVKKLPDTLILVSNCFNCHGTNGVSVGIIDELDSMSAKRLAKKMREFRSGAKAGTIMTRIAKGYSDAEIDVIANYIEKVND